MTILVDFMRHGEVEGGRAYRGHGVDDPLSGKGWQQMSAGVDHYCPWTHIISSPMLRCRAFAEDLAGRHDLPFEVEDRFKEVGFGRWEGKTPDEVITQWPEEYADFYRDPLNCRPEGAEPLEDFYARVGAAMADMAKDNIDRRVLVVAHAGVIRAALTNAMNAAPGCMYRFKIPYAAMSRLSFDEKGWFVEFVNGQLTE